ncbi:hypothetical protein GIB67_043065 [Kingdonia uniflora]|uniref:Uncharacterized protein n=1 Tax=Kingdonia uniflora TaxID=39325 RepID=A0A7J7MA77_9MAGN|nr:hypothetical protein GIB67_043065 [Kingdonia uniflora]
MRKVSSLNSVEFLQLPKLKIKEGFEFEKGYLSNLIESRLIASRKIFMGEEENLNVDDNYEGSGLDECPLCGVDIMGLSEEQRYTHTINCLDRDDFQKVIDPITNKFVPPYQVVNIFPILEIYSALDLMLSDRERRLYMHLMSLEKPTRMKILEIEMFHKNKGFVPSRVQPGTEMNKLGSGRRKGPIRNHVENGKMVKASRMVLQERIASKIQRLKLKYFGDQSLENPTPIPVPTKYQGMSENKVVEEKEEFYCRWRLYHIVLTGTQH